MKVRIVKKRRGADLELLVRGWEKRYGSLSSLHQKVLISKCTSPDMMSDYVLWKHISAGAEFEDIVILRDAEVFDILSPRRMELLEYLTNNHATSIKALATGLHRNYKNVYDDLQALAKFDLIDLNESGRSLRPGSVVTKIEVTFEI